MSRNAMNKQSGKAGAVALLESAAGRILGDLEKGKFLGRVDEKLKELAKAMEELGGKGNLVVTLDFNTQSGRSASTTIMGTVAIKGSLSMRSRDRGFCFRRTKRMAAREARRRTGVAVGSAVFFDDGHRGSVVEGRFQRKAG